MNPVPMQCPLCAGMIQIDPAYAGQQVGCPLCQGVMVLPPPEFFGLPASFASGYPAEPQPGYSFPGFPPSFPPQGFSPPGYPPQPHQEPPPSLTQLGCPVCGGAFQVSPEMAGQQVACPHCQNAVTIPLDLFGGMQTPGFTPQSVPSPSFEMPQHGMQFIGLPPGMTSSPEIPTGVAAPQSFAPPYGPPDFGANPGVPVGIAAGPLPQQTAPAFAPTQYVQPPQPSPPEPDARSERREDANMYPPGMTPKDVGSKKENSLDRTEHSELAKDDRFPPGKERREPKESKRSKREKPVTEREQRYPPGMKPLEEPKQESTRPPERITHESPPAELPPPVESSSRVDDLLPPGATADMLPPGVDSPLPPKTSPARAVDALLPPGAADASPSSAESDAAVSRHTVVDTLLPPGAPTDPSAVPTEQVALPDAPPPAPRPIPTAGPSQIVVPTPEGDFVTVEKKEGVKTITDHGQEIEIRKLSPEERTRRRRVKNIVMFTFAVVLLIVVIVIMTRR